jgi:hypothetical protein
MSLSTQDRPQNPAKFFLKVKSGAVSYYDKEAGENIDVPVPFEFVVLDQLATVKGWSDADGSGYWSNEVKRAGSDALTVRTSKGVKATGIWKDIKSDAFISGAKFNASVYLAHKSGDKLVISNMALSGAALNAWIEFIQANKGVMKGKNKVVLSGFADAKKGAVKYQVPVFETTDVTDEELEEATNLDKELQSYLGDYLNYKSADEPKEDVVIEDLGGDPIDPIDLNDIPF